jgi:tetratricopeptide (TPR) repeat protein
LAYFAKGQYERAIQDYDEAIRLRPNYAKAFNNRGNAYRKLGQNERAIEDYDEAIHLKSTGQDVSGREGQW